jgi:hypothetical protein
VLERASECATHPPIASRNVDPFGQKMRLHTFKRGTLAWSRSLRYRLVLPVESHRGYNTTSAPRCRSRVSEVCRRIESHHESKRAGLPGA